MFLTETASQDRYIEIGLASETTAGPPIDVHKMMRTGDIPNGAKRSIEPSSFLDAQRWLPFAAESLRISANLEDYVVVPCTIFLTDLPNANLAAFPFEEMTAWNPRAGQITYRTWVGKPTHLEHANNDHTQAKGVILDAMMRPVRGYDGNLHRVVLLLAFDRMRDPATAGRVAAGRSGFSMGSFVGDYRCSACDASLRQGGCRHIHPQGGVLMANDGNRLVYRIARNCEGFECSSVGTPAFRFAVAEPIG